MRLLSPWHWAARPMECLCQRRAILRPAHLSERCRTLVWIRVQLEFSRKFGLSDSGVHQTNNTKYKYYSHYHDGQRSSDNSVLLHGHDSPFNIPGDLSFDHDSDFHTDFQNVVFNRHAHVSCHVRCHGGDCKRRLGSDCVISE